MPVNEAWWRRRLPATLFLAIAVYFFFRTQSYSAPHNVHLANVAMQNLDGSDFNSKSLQGKAVVLNFWAPWCAPCRLEMPWLQRLQEKNAGLVVVGVEDDPDAYWNAQHMQGRNAVTYPLVQASPAIRRNFGQVVSLPTTLYISRSGRVLHTVSGLIPESLMGNYADQALHAP